ncbi:MAG: CotH kinase family protein [Paludibacter sp.]|jgi:hypothetical protein|nr:CotH kinase family protein [Paludibacter sp.]
MKTFRNLLVLSLFAVAIQTSTQAQTQLTNLPTFYITTTNNAPVANKETWVPGNITVVSSDASENLTIALDIRGRGNSTWGMAKKPYRIKLNKKTNLLNLPAKQKNWVLLANYADKTLIRNAVGFKISELLGFEYTAPTRFVDVYLNGAFQGNYMLTDQIEVAEDLQRVPVEELKITDTALPKISGGYLVEIDGFANGEPEWFTTTQALKVTIKYPKDDEINAQQRTYIHNIIQTFEDALFATDFTNPTTGYRSLVDTTSLINWYIASELTGNSDSFWSTYIYKKRNNDKIVFGPLWDMDIAFNNDNRLGNAVQKLMRDYAHAPRTWIQRLWQDEWFRAAVNRRWIEFKNGTQLNNNLLAYVDSLNNLINASQQQNFTRWNILNQQVYNEQFLFPTYAGGVNYLKTYITQRINFLTTSFASTQPPVPTAAFVAENFYYRILNEGSNNAIAVADSSLLQGSALYMWSPIDNDSSQLWSIKALANNHFQIINLNSGMAITGNGRQNNLTQTLPDTTIAAQRWKITPVLTGGLYGLENVASNLSANNSGGSTANGTPLIEYDNAITLAEKRNQHWYLSKVMQIPDTTPNAIIAVHNTILKIYPNPAKNYITIAEQANKQLVITDLLGKIILKTTIQSNNENFNISQFPASVYFINITDASGNVNTSKLLKL